MCHHATTAEANRCACTGYGFGDLPCRCGMPKSDHKDGTGACRIPAARCHEFVLRPVPDPPPVSEGMIMIAAQAIDDLEAAGPGAESTDLARVALFAGAAVAMVRDWELEALRRDRNHHRNEADRLRGELADQKRKVPG
jgi:hypothetical protein